MSETSMHLVEETGSPPYYTFDLLASSPTLMHGVFTRHGGVSVDDYATLNVSRSIGDEPEAVATNRDRVLAALGRAGSGLRTAGLVHGTKVAQVDSTRDTLSPGGVTEGVDALITDDPGVTLLITAADCAQVFLYDRQRAAIGLAHAGWRGASAGILEATTAAMEDRFGSRPTDLLAAIGPSLGPCCARFSDPEKELPAWCAPYIRGHHVDLWAIGRAALLRGGISDDRIATARICTACRRDLFFSHRGDRGRTGRFGAAFALRDSTRLSALESAV